MKRRSRAGRKPIKGRRHKAPEPERGNERKGQQRSKSSPAIEETEVARLTRELTDERRQRVATSEVLRLLSGSHGDLNQLFDTILANATDLCQANFGTLSLCEGDAFRIVAMHNVPAGLAELRRREPLVRTGPLLRMAETKRFLHIADYMEYVASHPADSDAAAFAKLTGVRTILEVPMLKDDDLVGAIVIYRAEVRRFDNREIALLNDFAAQAVITIENTRLLNELRQRTTDLSEALEQQTATSEVLQVISRSPGDLEPVFASMLEKAVRICDATFGNIYRWDGDALHLVATCNTPPAFAKWRKASPMKPAGPQTVPSRLLASHEVVHVTDAAADPGYADRSDPGAVAGVELGGVRTALAVPMRKEDELIGAFTVYRQEVRPFTDKQIELVKNFAAQAVIAIENARLLNELRRRTTDLTEALDQQTATSDVLQVISTSPADLEPVFTSMLEKAVRICDATFGNIYRWDCEFLNLVAAHNTPPAFEDARRSPRRPDPKMPVGRMLSTKTTIHVVDLAADESYIEHRIPEVIAAVELGSVRTFLAVPMLKDNELIGALSLSRQELRPFTDKQIELIKNFAAQAVIAIENARLLNELRQRTSDLTDALEQQTATSDVLQVIAGTTGNLEPVFGTMLEKAVRYCDANFGTLFLRERDQLSLVAAHNMPIAFSEAHRRSPGIVPGGPVEVAMRTGRAARVPDLAATQSYLERHPTAVAAVELGGVRTTVAVPMLKDNEPIGAIAIHRPEVRPFTDKQIGLLANFAAQAVIAIENARLLDELRQRTTDLTERTADLTEALEQQTATSEVLQAISSSPGDLQLVFQAMLEKAVRICDAKFGSILRWDDEAAHLVATHNAPPAFTEARRRSLNPANPKTSFGRMVAAKAVVHVADAAAEPGYVEERDPAAVAAVELGGQRTALYVPMLKETELVGAFTLSRQEVRPFTDKQIELVQNFAAQAVIAIENARLLNELRQRTGDLEQALEQQTATSEVLQVISTCPGDLEPVFATMLENAVRICEAKFGNIYRWNGDALTLIATHNTPSALAEARKRSPILRFGPKNPVGHMIATKTVVRVEDAAASEAYFERDPATVAAVELGGTRTFVAVPMLMEDELVGAFALARQEVRPFADKQIELLKNFAAQAVIAIENARLLNELRQSLEQQTATAEVLQVVSSSLGDLEPVFTTMLEKAVRICDATFGNIYRWDGEFLSLAATHKTPPLFAAEVRRRSQHPRDPKTVSGRMLETKAVVHIADLAAEGAYLEQRHPAFVAGVELGGVRTILAVPMWKEDELIGSFTVYRQEVRPFTEKQIELVQNFAAQAVIAIENTRLLKELRERTQQVEAQAQELSKLNQQLEHRVSDQVGEIERMSRLRRFLPPQVADLIVASGSEKQLESHRREITALFCDLRGFTGFTESADAEDVMALLRDYHAAIGEIIIKYNGTLERYAGDGVMVVFNDPVPVENPALQAVLMALELREAIGALTATWSRLGHEIGFGIGIAHGFATLGTIGFEGRFDYAAIGTVSNVASRLCDEAKPGQILVSPRVLMKVENAVRVEPVGEFELKGIRRPLPAYNVVDALSRKPE